MFIVSLVAGIVVACTPADAAFFNNTAVKKMIDGVAQAELEPYVMELTSEVPTVIGGQNYTIQTRSSSSGPSGIGMAEQYMYEKLQSYKLDVVSYQNYPGKGGSVAPGRNVIGRINGTTSPDEIVIISAHLDARPWSDLSYGADDDASGCTAVLYLARSFAKRNFERTICFIFFGSEENAPWTSSTLWLRLLCRPVEGRRGEYRGHGRRRCCGVERLAEQRTRIYGHPQTRKRPGGGARPGNCHDVAAGG